MAEIRKVAAYKVDCFLHDLLRRLAIAGAHGDVVAVIAEEDEGVETFLEEKTKPAGWRVRFLFLEHSTGTGGLAFVLVFQPLTT